MKNRTIICLFCFTFLATIACKNNKENEASPSDTRIINRDIAGIYEGRTHDQISDAGNKSGYKYIDTTYNDNIEVLLINPDSVKFSRGGTQYRFRLDTIDFYMKWLSKNTIISFKFLKDKELQYSFETKNWIGDSLHSRTTTFKGYRK